MPGPSNPLQDFISSTHIGPSQSHKALKLWPLIPTNLDRQSAGLGYISLGDAMRQGTIVIDEVSEAGSVPNVRVHNRGKQAVLFLFGEQIVGAKQNRVANASFLVPSQSEVILDVSCVEVGRWAHAHRRRSESSNFKNSDEVLSGSLRKKMAMKVAESRRRGSSFSADQGEVWNEIGTRLRHSRTASPSSAYSDYLGSRMTDLDELTASFHPVEGQVGFVACFGDQVAGAEIIGRPEVFRANFHPLLRSYAIDAIDHAMVRALERSVENRFDSPEPFLEALARAEFSWGPSLGAGEDLRLRGGPVMGCALACEELVHLTAFPA
jgi:hypothetical protein